MNLHYQSAPVKNIFNKKIPHLVILHSLILILLIFQSSLYSQNRFNLSQFKDESFRFIKQPSVWESSDWTKLGLIGAGTILLMQIDQPIREFALKNQNYSRSFSVEAGRIWGEGFPTILLAGAFGLHGLMMDSQSSKKIGFEIVQAALYAGAVTTVLKVVAGRARPFTDRGSGTYRAFSFFDDDFHSLPSGHVTLAFSLSTVLSKNAKSDLLKILAYIPAVLTAVSRVYQDNHWTSDAFLGAAIGYFVGDWVSNQHKESTGGIETVSILPLSLRIAVF